MKIGFWNLKANDIGDCVAKLIIENSLDVLFVCENVNLNIEQILQQELNGYNYHYNMMHSKIGMIISGNCKLNKIQPSKRYMVCELQKENLKVIIAPVHLYDNTNGSKSNARREIFRDIKSIFVDFKGDESISCFIIGDFNADPFNDEMLSKVDLTSVLFKQLMIKNVIKYNGKNYERFYNPVLEMINVNDEIFGSFYYESNESPLYWHCYDQIVMNKDAMEYFDYGEYIQKIADINLLKNNRPNRDISDHLPVILKLKGGI